MAGLTYTRSFEIGARRPLKSHEFEKILYEIWREHDRRRSTKFSIEQTFGSSPNEDAKNFLRREIYALGRCLKAVPPKWDIVEIISGLRIHKVRRPKALHGNIFHALLMGVYEEDTQIPRQERSKMAKELLYADRHNVPPEYLCGFLYQSGGRDNLEEKLNAGYLEPAFCYEAELE